MGMRLTPEHMAEIASKVEELDKVGVEIKEVGMHGHKVFMKKVNGSHVVVGISLDTDGKPGGNTR